MGLPLALAVCVHLMALRWMDFICRAVKVDGCYLQGGCDMNTDDDAELALKISNALTQALLEHRQSALRAAVSSLLIADSIIIILIIKLISITQ